MIIAGLTILARARTKLTTAKTVSQDKFRQNSSRANNRAFEFVGNEEGEEEWGAA